MNRIPPMLACACLLLTFFLPAGFQGRVFADNGLIDVGWHDDFTADRGWRAEPWQVTNPAEQPVANFGSNGARFEVGSPEKMMAWTRTTNPIWVDPFSVLEIEYACEGSFQKGFPQLLLFDDSTGPITPNALNPENPLAGEHESIVTLDAGRNTQTVDLRKLYPSDRIARVSLRLAAGDSKAAVTIKRLAFRTSASSIAATSPASAPTTSPLLQAGEAESPGKAWKPIELPGQPAVSAMELARALGCAQRWPDADRYSTQGIDFQLAPAERAALATGIMEEQSLRVAGNWQGSQLALLLASRTFGNAAPWYAPTSVRMRQAIQSPHQLIVRVEYADGTVDSHFLQRVAQKPAQVERMPAAYTVPLEASKRMVAFSIVDRMSYGQVFLLAASVNTSPAALTGERNLRNTESPRVELKPTVCNLSGSRLVVENAWIRLACDLADGPAIQSLSLMPFDRKVLSENSASSLVEVFDENRKPIVGKLIDAKSAIVPGGAEIRMSWAMGEPADKHVLDILLAVRDQGLIEIRPALRNETNATWSAVLSAPAIKAASISKSPADAFHLVGTCNTTLGNEDVKIESAYGGPSPLPLIDIFAEQGGGGLGMFTVDREMFTKTLLFRQTAGKAEASIRFEPLLVPANGTVELPAVTVLAHAGDWHDAFAAYRSQAQEAFGTGLCKPGSPLAKTFYCRRDYPLGGTTYLFDPARRVYTADALVNEASRAFGGLDMIDISGWAYNEKTGRVGDYLTNDLGGLDAVEKLVKGAHEDRVPVGLYFEGYLIDRRCELAKKAMPDWQLIKKDGKPLWWSGEMECFVCPGIKAWQNELAGMIAAVARKAGADAVYVDEYGYSIPGKACWSPNHGHPVPSNPIREERAMLQVIRERLAVESPQTAVYIEFAPADAMMNVTEASFDIALSYQGRGEHPTKMPLYRYAFPGLASFQMVSHGIRPVPFEADDLNCAIFHGMGVWLKGRADSWFTSEFRELAARAHGMFAQHGDIFRSADCEPLIPTLQPALFANRFSSGGKTIYTLYNASRSTIRGPLLQAALASQRTLTNLLSDDAVRMESDQTITGTVEPGCVLAVLCE